MYKLAKDNYPKINELFSPLRYQLFPAAVLEGLQDGQVFVDDLDDPRAGFLFTREVWGYLAGDPGDKNFNRLLNKAINQLAFSSEGAWGFLLGVTEKWKGEPLKAVLEPIQPIELKRRHYRGRRSSQPPQPKVPEGYSLEAIDQSLLERGMELPEDVAGLIRSWDSIANPSQRGFGFVVLHRGEVVAHAVIDVVVGKKGDIGLVTAPEHRRRGLGTLVSAVAVAHGFDEQGLEQILWDCGEENIGSLRLAEKLGFEFVEEHRMYICDYVD
jgi:RimJ/RimL family protein N-acetyltransferase